MPFVTNFLTGKYHVKYNEEAKYIFTCQSLSLKMQQSYQWAFKKMIRSERVKFSSNIRNYDVLIDMGYVRWQYLR